jgi:hypothetical protein
VEVAWVVVELSVGVEETSAVGTIEGAASMMTARVEVEAKPFWTG